MAKVSFTKLGLTKNQEVNIVEWNNQSIEVKSYLPVNEKLELISNVINRSADDNNFANPVKVDIFSALEILEFYTNISFTEKQKEDPCKLYDLFIGNELYMRIIQSIPIEEYQALVDGIRVSVDAVYNYRNSVMGILENVSTDYSNLNLDATEIQKKIGDPENMALLKQVLTKLG